MNGDELKLLYRIDEKVDNLVKQGDKFEAKIDELSEIIPTLVPYIRCSNIRKDQKKDKRGTYAMITAAISVVIAAGSFLIKLAIP